jgi:hypothetical protein
MLRTAYEIRDERSHIVVFQVRSAQQTYIDFDQLIAHRKAMAARDLLIGAVVSVTILLLAIGSLIRSPWPKGVAAPATAPKPLEPH